MKTRYVWLITKDGLPLHAFQTLTAAKRSQPKLKWKQAEGVVGATHSWWAPKGWRIRRIKLS